MYSEHSSGAVGPPATERPEAIVTRQFGFGYESAVVELANVLAEDTRVFVELAGREDYCVPRGKEFAT